uniref:PDZ domain-containing protein n=2 Tax=Tetranychus urticae TaxID=32264 RepID=T1KEV3_TETUR
MDSRCSLVNYLASESESESGERTYEILLLPDQSKAISYNRLASPTSSPPHHSSNSGSFTLMDEDHNSNGQTDNLSANNNSNATKYYECDKQYNRRISLTENLLSGLSPTRTAISGIPEFVETSIVLRKDKSNELGIRITGGSDTYLESIVVCEVDPDGAAYKDGRLRKGDLILAVNDISFREVSYKDALRVLKEASSPLKLLVLRENPQTLFTTSQSPSKFITVQLRKASIKDKLGLSFVQRTNGRGVFITYVQPGSIAARQGRKIMQGDQILEINGQNVRDSNQKDVAQMVNNLDGEIVLLFGRNQSLSNAIQEWCRKKSQIHWRTRTSTWSAYGGNKDKVQNQRPSLPAAKDQPYFLAKYSPDKETVTTGFTFGYMPGTSNGIENEDPNMVSRSSSIRSRTRLSIVVEDTKARLHQDSIDSLDDCQIMGNNPLLPSIQVTEF